MLRFFQRIRKDLLESGKIRNYTLYAIGEIALVVIGILIALQISNWNEQRKENAIANDYLIALKNEFQANISELDRIIADSDTVFRNASQFFSLAKTTTEKPGLTEKEIGIFIDEATQFVQYEPQMGVINDVVNSGKIALFKNDSLRNFISSWGGLISKLQLREEDLIKGQDWLTKFLLENGNVHNTGYYGRDERIPKSRFERSNLHLLEMVTFEGLISKIAGNSIELRDNYYPQFKEKLEQQIAIINRELD